jgi:hypothetical protein
MTAMANFAIFKQSIIFPPMAFVWGVRSRRCCSELLMAEQEAIWDVVPPMEVGE